MVELKDVSVTYRFRKALDCVSLRLEPGKSMALLGMNGAGKTTLVRSILGMIRFQGEIKVFGDNPGNIRSYARLGFAPEEALPPTYLNGQEYLCFWAKYRLKDSEIRKKEVGELLEWFGIEPEKRIQHYSKGMRRRLLLAAAFLGTPEFIILDEPLNGLDPILIVKLRERLLKHQELGGCILYCSHILAEVEKTCSDVAILKSGKLVYQNKMTEAVSSFGSVENAFTHWVSS